MAFKIQKKVLKIENNFFRQSVGWRAA